MGVSFPTFSICIPAYNRSSVLAPLLDSIFLQNESDFEVVICEDNSKERKQISDVVKHYQGLYPNKIRYFENEVNLGYDGNLRNLVNKSCGDYCLFMGNDDLLYKGALTTLLSVVGRHSDCGVIVRSFAEFEKDPNKIIEVFRYFADELVIPAGEIAISTAFRRSVVIPGMVIHRKSALKYNSTKFDGSLLYQLYLVGMILAERSVVFVPEIIALRRSDFLPDFGNSEFEKGKFTPTEQTIESSVFFIRGMFNIAKYVSEKTYPNVFKYISKDIGNYSYPLLSIQSDRNKIEFIKYYFSLNKIGLWKYPLFHIYFLALLLFKPKKLQTIINFFKKRLGYTPSFGLIKKAFK